MERVFRKTTEEERERHRRMRENFEAQLPELIARDKLYLELWSLADESKALLEFAERGEVPPPERVQTLREKVDEALASRTERAAV